MAKVTDQNVPPELQTMYDNMVSPQKKAAPTTDSVRTRRRVHRGNGVRQAVVEMRAMRAAARFVLDRARTRHMPSDQLPTLRELASDLTRGIFDDRFWMLAEQLAEQVLDSVPTFVETPSKPSYLYPDAFNRPSTSTYPSGTLSAGFPEHTGETIGEVYRDTLLRWRMIRHDPFQQLSGNTRVPVLMHIVGSLDATASSREARALRTVTYLPKLTSQGSAIWSDYAYPFAGAPNTWPTRRTPESSPPYYAYNQQIEKTRNINYSSRYVADGTREVVTYSAPLPMDGYRYNNNTTIRTVWTGNEEIYVPMYADRLLFNPDSIFNGATEFDVTARGIQCIGQAESSYKSVLSGFSEASSLSSLTLAGHTIEWCNAYGSRDFATKTQTLRSSNYVISPGQIPTSAERQYLDIQKYEVDATWNYQTGPFSQQWTITYYRLHFGGGIERLRSEVVTMYQEWYTAGTATWIYPYTAP